MITGVNLGNTTGVTIGGVAATSVTVVNETTVTAVTPAGTAGSAAIAVTTPTGTSAQAVEFLYASTILPAWATLIEEFPDPAVVTNEALRAAIVATGYAWRVRDNASQIELLLIPPVVSTGHCNTSSGLMTRKKGGLHGTERHSDAWFEPGGEA